jgi:5S rRNA maturation endonuclease (ribonuclease M5)
MSDNTELLKKAIAAIPIRDLLRKLNITGEIPERDGVKFSSPLRPDQKPSCTIYDGRLHDWSRDEHLDAFDVFQRLTGLDSKIAFVPFVTIAGYAHELSGASAPNSGELMGYRSAPSIEARPVSMQNPESNAPQESYQLTLVDIRLANEAAQRLYLDARLIARMIEKRPEWSAEAIGACALAGDLGYRDGELLFIYSHGIKARGKATDGSRRFRWVVGNAGGECWRQSLLTFARKTVFITEGESDALTLLSLGFEMDGKTLVVALPGASILPKPEPFADRDVIIVEDADDAGSRAGERLAKRLGRYAASIKRVCAREVAR